MNDKIQHPVHLRIDKLLNLNGFKLTILFVIVCFSANAQTTYTPYDELPTIIKSYKPAYDESYPQWGKKLYQYPINFNEICREFDQYINDEKPEKSALIRYFKIWRQAMEPYALTDGTIQLPDIQQLQQNLKSTQLNADQQLKSETTESSWSFLGPKETFQLNQGNPNNTPPALPWQANVYSIDVSKSNNNILFCGSETGCINKSTDKGQTWTFVSQHYLVGGGVTAIAIDPSNPNIVYAAGGNQIHKTTNGGVSWSPMLPSNNLFYADRLRIDPSNSQKIVAASNKGIFVSLDAGLSWEKKWSSACYDIEFKLNETNVIYGIAKNNSENFEFIVSTDGGLSFSVNSSFPAGIPDHSGGLIAVTKANYKSIFVVLLSSQNNNTPYLYKGTNTNNTITWSLLATGKTTNFGMNNGQGYFDLVLDVSPVNENIIFVGTTTFYKSTDGGAKFTSIGGYSGNFSIHYDIQDIKMMDNGEMWVTTDGGVNYSSDNFTNTSNWSTLNRGIVGSHFWGFDQGWNQDLIVGGRYHNGNTAIADFYGDKALRLGGAESATGWVLQGKDNHVAFNDLGDGYILPNSPTGNVQGRFTFSKYPNMFEYGGKRSNLIHHPNYYGTLFLGEGKGIWKSEDMGASFIQLKSFNHEVVYLQMSYKNPNVLYVDVIDEGLYKSDDGGKSWTAKPSLTNGTYPGTSSFWKGRLHFAISPYNENLIYACLSNGTWSNDVGKIFKSIDGGNTWIDYSGTVSGTLKDIVIQPTNDGVDLLYLFITSKGGKPGNVFYRKDGMSDWLALNTNYPQAMDMMAALPFYRDAKLRVGGTVGAWECSMVEPSFKPIINPWCQGKMAGACDTVYFDDHSMLNWANASWKWSFSPQPIYVSNTNVRNPKVVFGNLGSYTVTLEVTQNGQVFSKKITNMIETTESTCGPDGSPGLSFTTTDMATRNIDIGKIPFKGNEFTIMFWVKPSGKQGSFAQVIGTNTPNTRFGVGFSFQSYTKNLNLVFTHTSIGYWATSSIDLDSLVWSHIALVYTPTGVTIYRNGKDTWSYTNGEFGPVDFSQRNFAINEDIHAQGGNFSGEIDEIAFYNTALNLTQIREKMHLTKNETEPNLVHYIQFNQYSESSSTLRAAIGGCSSIVSNSKFTSSNAPVGQGISYTLNNVNSAGNYAFGTTGIEMTFGSAGTYPNGSLVGFKLMANPDTKPIDIDSLQPSNTYFIINNYGTNSNFSKLTSLRFNNLDINPFESFCNNDLRLYNRNSFDFGDTWSTNFDASSQIITNSDKMDVFFNNNLSLLKFGQLALVGNPIDSITEDISICDGDEYLGHTESGQFTRTLNTVAGCDSIIITNLTVNPSYSITEAASICEGDEYLGHTETGQYVRNFTTTTGCDSIIIANLTVNPIPEKPNLTLSNDTLFSSFETGNSWFKDSLLILNEVASFYLIQSGGNYMVQITSEYGCLSEKSEELFVSLTSIDEEFSSKLKIYPNPTSGIISIEGLPIDKEILITVYDINGILIKSITTSSSNAQIDINKKPSGTYLLILKSKTEQFLVRIIKQ